MSLVQTAAGREKTWRENCSVCRVVSFTSGKGGVGKTNSAVNIGISLASRGKSVLLLDADLGLANIDVLLGLKPQATLYDVLKGEATLDDVILRGPGDVSLIPAASGIAELGALSTDQRQMLFAEVERVAAQYDYLIIDTGAGIGADVLSFNGASTEIVCVVTPEPTSLTDSYALIKVMATKLGEKRFSVMVNGAESEGVALRAYSSLADSVQRFLQVSLRYLGCVPYDRSVGQAVMNRRAVAIEQPSSKAARALDRIAVKIDDCFGSVRVKGGMQLFFEQLLAVEGYGR